MAGEHKKLTLSVEVQGPPDSASHASALTFLGAWLDAGHRVYRVFFYHDAVLAAAEERSRWSTLSGRHGFELAVCVGAAERRGVGGNADSRYPVAPPFEIVGLGQLIDAIARSDRFITFAP